MRILILCTRLSFGGAERVAVMWANGFVASGHKVMVLSNLFDPITYTLDQRIMVRNLVPENRCKWKKWGGAIGRVRKAVKEFQPVVAIGVMSTCSFIAYLATTGMKIPIIATEHNSFDRPSLAPLSKWEVTTKYFLNKLYSCVTVLTDVDREFIGTRLKNVVTMPNPLALQPLETFPMKKKVILAAGRIDAWKVKGFDLLIRAYSKVFSSLKSQVSRECWRLQIAGIGSEESLNYLKQLCKDNAVEDFVDFLGFRTDIEELYKQSEIFVLSSRYEGFGLVLIEAMSQGCACVACDYKGRQSEIIRNSEEGLTCEPDNVDALANSISRLIEDEEYRKRIQKNAIERSKYYSIEKTIDRWSRVLETVVNKK